MPPFYSIRRGLQTQETFGFKVTGNNQNQGALGSDRYLLLTTWSFQHQHLFSGLGKCNFAQLQTLQDPDNMFCPPFVFIFTLCIFQSLFSPTDRNLLIFLLFFHVYSQLVHCLLLTRAMSFLPPAGPLPSSAHTEQLSVFPDKGLHHILRTEARSCWEPLFVSTCKENFSSRSCREQEAIWMFWISETFVK